MERSVPVEELTSGASGRIIPVFRNIRRSVPSPASLLRVLLFLHALAMWFLLFIRRRSPISWRSTAASASSRRRTGVGRWSAAAEEEDVLRRRALAERVEMAPLSEEGGGEVACRCGTFLFLGPRRTALYCRSWVPTSGGLRTLWSASRGQTEAYWSFFPIRLSSQNLSSLSPGFRKIGLICKWRSCEINRYYYYCFYNKRVAFSATCRGILVIIHGLNEHSGRYSHFAKQLMACNFGVYAMDWIGHGGSDGLHGYVPSLDYVVEDTGKFLEKIKSDNPGVPCFLFGHSTGGAVVLKAASYPHIEAMVEGIILTSPALRVKPAHPIVGAVAPIFSLVLPKFQFKGANKRGIPVSRDPAAISAKYSDPLVYTRPIRVRTGHEILRISSYLLQNMKSITVPFFVLHGTADRVTDPLASQDLYNVAASRHKDIKLYEGFLHDLLFEPEHDEVGGDIINWMLKMLQLQNL
ncbi:Monoglyceride lipase [Musa troglodytarum]|uniref:Monoglyceride lipase n=1 Tax=Musa troglodytarum TaxID=320322 RepID=A0A9E7IBK9_9LILI|nr:Monoglyceride lipase [Musa troglodytarum]